MVLGGVGIAAKDYLDRPESSGRCSAVLDLRIVDPDGHELPTGQRGELQVRGTAVLTWVMTPQTDGPQIDMPYVVVMQRLHEDDLAGHLIGQGGWHHLDLPAIAAEFGRLSFRVERTLQPGEWIDLDVDYVP